MIRKVLLAYYYNLSTMSLFRKLIDRTQPAKALDTTDATQVAIKKNQEVTDMLQRKQEYLEKQITGQLIEAKKHGRTNKQKALLHLKRKARLQKELDRTTGQIDTLEAQLTALQTAAQANEVLGAMQATNSALKQQKWDADKAAALLDDMQDRVDDVNEIANELARPIGVTVDLDDLETELDDLMQEDLDNQLLQVNLPSFPPVPVPVPVVPAIVPVVPDADMDELMQWAA